MDQKPTKTAHYQNNNIEDLLWKKKPAFCFVSSCDLESMLWFGDNLLQFHLTCDWLVANKHSRNFLCCSWFYRKDYLYNIFEHLKIKENSVYLTKVP